MLASWGPGMALKRLLDMLKLFQKLLECHQAFYLVLFFSRYDNNQYSWIIWLYFPSFFQVIFSRFLAHYNAFASILDYVIHLV